MYDVFTHTYTHTHSDSSPRFNCVHSIVVAVSISENLYFDDLDE